MKELFTKKQNVVTLLLFLVFSNVFAQLSLVSNQNIDFSTAVSTTTSGNWSNPAIWSNGAVPNATTDVIINDSHTVYIDVQGSASGVIVDLCRNLQVKPTAILRMGHNTANFAKDLRINGSILCNGTFSAGRNLPGATGDGSIYLYNSRIFLNLTQDQTYIAGSGFFNPRSLSIASNLNNKNLTIDLYNMILDDNFAIKSDKLVNVNISHFAYVRVKKVLGLTGSDYANSAATAKSNLTIQGIVVANDVSLFTKNTTVGESSSITIANQGSLYTQKINNGVLNLKTEAAGFTLTINSGGLFRLGKEIDYTNLTTANPNFVFSNNGELRKHYSETQSSTATITSKLDQYDPTKGASVPQIKDVFGASHISGWYNFTNKPYLLEGLDVYKEFGATSLKTTLTSVNGNMESAYHFNDNWPNFNNLKEVAQYKYLDSLFKRTHIKRHTFWTTTKNQTFYKNGPDFNHANYLDQEQQFYDLTKYLLQTYGTMDKTFTYQNWEGDWMLRGEGVPWETDPSTIPDDVDWEIEGMARLFRARQRGTERARNEFSGATAKVFHAIEFNKLWMTDSNGNKITMMDNNTPSVLENVIPSTRIDLSSWSAYDGGWNNTNYPIGHAMWKGLEMARYFTTQTGDLDFDFPVQIGEFGINENPLRYDPAISNPTGITNRYERYIGVALGLGIPNFYLWNLYGNDKAGPINFTWEKDTQYDTAFLNEWLLGKWLKTPDGSWGVAATFLMDQWLSSTTWTGATNTAWNTATNWSKGVPTSISDVTIGTGTFQPSPFLNINIKSLTINSGATLVVNPNYNLTVKEKITNNGTLTIKNNANLIQVDNVANTGNIAVNRNSNPLLRLDYTMWSSPVSGAQTLAGFSPFTSLSPIRFYNYNETTNLYNAIADPINTTFAAAIGYLIRMPNNHPTSQTVWNGSFSGVPNNGTINKAITYNGAAFGYNAIGNPYPSTLDAQAFITANTTNIKSSLYFWRKINAGAGSAYAVYSPLGGTTATLSSELPNGTIQIGQGFFVKAKSTSNVTFTNAMRIANNQNQFFKTKQTAKDRIWLNLTNTAGVFSQALIGYIADATTGVDMYDAKYINDSPIALTSNINNEEYTIQGRPAFDPSDLVALNFKTDADGDYTIALDHFDGAFASGQDIYLLDSKTGAETNLKSGAYTFTATAGVDNDRFSLKYQKTLRVDAPAFNENNVRVYKNNGVLYVNSNNVAINNIKVFDIQGRLITEQKNLKANRASVSNLEANQALIVQVTSEDNYVVNKKVVN